MTKKIKIMKDGPYRVEGAIPLKSNIIGADKNGIAIAWLAGKREFDTKDAVYHLCRCGHSKTKPFCDAAHIKTKFDGTETASNEPFDKNVTIYKGRAIDLHDNDSFCAVARFCDQGEQVWRLVKKEDEESIKLAVIEACNCPAGRLVIVDKKGNRLEPELPQEIGVVLDPAKNCQGPLWVKGGIEIEGADGTKYEVRNRVTLCRCGESSNMPFCDASHLSCPHMKGVEE